MDHCVRLPIVRHWLAGLLVLTVGCSAWAGEPDRLERSAELSPLAPRAMLLGAARAGDRLVAVGERGIVVVSDDGGHQWRQVKVPVQSTLTAVTFPTATQGWAVGHDGVILHTEDAGSTWRRQLDGHRINELVLQAARARVQAAAEALPGASGTARAPLGAAQKEAQSSLDDAEAGARFGPTRPLLGTWFRDVHEGYATGAYGVLLQTRDGGVTWALLSHRLDNPDGLHLNALAGLDGGCVGLAGERGQVFISCDQGLSWRRRDTGYQGQLYGLLSGSDSSVLAFGFGGHLFRMAADGTWRTQPSGSRKSLVAGARTRDGVLLLDQSGLLLAGTADGEGLHPVHAGMNPPSRALTAVSDLVATPTAGGWLVVGRGGTMLKRIGNQGTDKP